MMQENLKIGVVAKSKLIGSKQSGSYDLLISCFWV